MMPTSIDAYAVLGHPIHHSRSPQIHTAFAHQTGQSLRYTAIDVSPANLIDTLNTLPSQGFRGVNITVPHKEAACQYTAEHGQLTARAARAGAVNTLAWTSSGLIGDNTDGPGLLNDLQQRHRLPLTGKRLLVLGAGGATRGIILPLLQAAPAALVIANRTAERATALADLFKSASATALCPLHGCGLHELSEYIASHGPFDGVINATSASLGGEAIELPPDTLDPEGFAYDMMYSKTLTPFLQTQQQRGIQHIADGLGMLVEQAALAFALWRGIHPESQPVYLALRDSLAHT